MPAEMTKDNPAPTWIPFTTGIGIAVANHRNRPVILKINTTADVVKPADIVSPIENFLAMATAAIA